MSIIYKQNGDIKGFNVGAMIVLSIIFLIVIGMISIPQYKVWQMSLSGKGLLAEAEYSKQAAVQKAKADFESSILLAQAEVERARGIASSTEIISGQLQNNEAYLQYLAIQAQVGMANSQNHTTVYIPSGLNGIPLIKNIDSQ